MLMVLIKKKIHFKKCKSFVQKTVAEYDSGEMEIDEVLIGHIPDIDGEKKEDKVRSQLSWWSYLKSYACVDYGGTDMVVHPSLSTTADKSCEGS